MGTKRICWVNIVNCEPVNYESIHVTHDKDYQTKRNEQMVRRIRQGLRQFYKVCKFAKGQTGVLMLDDWWSLSLPFSSPLIGTLKLAGTRRDSQGLAGTRRDSQELAGNTGTRRNLQGLAGTLELSNTGTLLLLGRLAWLMVGEGGRA